MARLGSGAWNGRRARVPQQWCRQPAEKGAREAARSVTASMGYVGLILRCGRGGEYPNSTGNEDARALTDSVHANR